MRITVSGKAPVGVQLAKYIAKKGHIVLQLDFPLARWSEPYYARLRETLREHVVPFVIEPTPATPEVPEFLVVDIGSDPEAAAALVRVIVREVFAIPPEAELEIFYQNVSPRDEIIDSS